MAVERGILSYAGIQKMTDDLTAAIRRESHTREYRGYTFNVQLREWYKHGIKRRIVMCVILDSEGETVKRERSALSVGMRPGIVRRLGQSLGLVGEREDVLTKSDHVMRVIEDAREVVDRETFGDPTEMDTEAAIDTALDEVRSDAE